MSNFKIDTPTELLEDIKIEALVVNISEFTNFKIEIKLIFINKITIKIIIVFLKILLI